MSRGDIQELSNIMLEELRGSLDVDLWGNCVGSIPRTLHFLYYKTFGGTLSRNIDNHNRVARVLSFAIHEDILTMWRK